MHFIGGSLGVKPSLFGLYKVCMVFFRWQFAPGRRWEKKTFDYWKKNKAHPYSPHWKKNLRHWKEKLKNLYFEPFCS